MMWWSKKF